MYSSSFLIQESIRFALHRSNRHDTLNIVKMEFLGGVMNKKKKRIVVVILILAAIGISAYIMIDQGGNVSHVQTSFSDTDSHKEEDIRKAMEIVRRYFRKEFKGCTLTKLWYEENFSSTFEGEWMHQYNGKEAIVLLSNFDVDGSGGDGSLNPNETYTDWEWILVKDHNDTWQLETWGY